jgi:hypothetical protein
MYSLSFEFRSVVFEKLLKQAEEMVFQYRGVNHPLIAHGRNVLPVKSASAVSARPDGTVSFNFSSRAVQAMMLESVIEAEAINDELADRMKANRSASLKGWDICSRLNHEVVYFLDSLRGIGGLTVDEMKDYVFESVRSSLTARP